jgi:1,2-phenylacetyl-CoA epoxidase PaaB subunit
MTCQHSKTHFKLWADLLVANQHLHVLFDHEVVVIRRQCLGRWIVPEHHIVSLLKPSARESQQHINST